MNEIQNIVLIGSGNVATHLAGALHHARLQVKQVYSPTLPHATELANKLDCAATNVPADILPDADLYIISIKDDAISLLNDTLRISNGIVVHTSGFTGMEAIKNISPRTGVFYPLQTFTKNRPISFLQIPLCLEASDPETLVPLKQTASKLSNRVYEIDSITRKRLHLAAVFANNFTNYLLGVSKEITGADLPFDILEPLVLETVIKAFETSPDQAQTGPAVRSDILTITQHLKMLENNPSARELYRIFSELIGEKSRRKVEG